MSVKVYFENEQEQRTVSEYLKRLLRRAIRETLASEGFSHRAEVSVTFVDNEGIHALNREYRKEFYGEGQYFWFLKSHGLTGTLTHCPEVTLVEENFIFPLPDAEVEYGWTQENEEDSEDNEKSADNDNTITPKA